MLKKKKEAIFVNNITKEFKIYTCAFEIWTKPRECHFNFNKNLMYSIHMCIIHKIYTKNH